MEWSEEEWSGVLSSGVEGSVVLCSGVEWSEKSFKCYVLAAKPRS